MEAPSPVMVTNLNRPKILLTQNYNIKNYILSISKTDNNSLIFKAKPNADLIICYYELEYEYKNFTKLSELFSKFNNSDEVYQFLIDNFKSNEKNLSIKNDCIEISFSLASTNENEKIKIYLDKKPVNPNINLNKLNSRIKVIEDNQSEIEKKIENIKNDINSIKDKQNAIEKEINLIKSIGKENKKTSENLESNYSKIKENFEKIKHLLEIEKKVEELNKYNDENKNNINSQKNILDELNNKVSNYKNCLEEKNRDINEIKNNQMEMKKDIDKKKEKMESIINLVSSIKIQNDILKKEMNDNSRKIHQLESKLEQKLIKKRDRPTNLKLKKIISSDLFEKKSCNNASACIFKSYEDNNIYIVYGIKTFDLECYDIEKNNKFILIKKLHDDCFYSCRHYFYKEKNQDLIITSSLDNHVKVTYFKKEKSEVILDLKFNENKMPINTAYINYEYIIIPFSDDSKGYTEIYAMDSSKIGEFGDYTGFVLGLTTYFDEKKNQNYVIISNRKGILSFLIDSLYLFQKYIPDDSLKKEKNENGFSEAIVFENNNKLILVGPSFYQGLYLWDFIYGDFIYKIDMGMGINNIYLWNNDFLFVSVINSKLYGFILIDANQKKIDIKIKMGKKEQCECGIQLLRILSKGNFLISFSNKGELKLHILK